MIPIVRSYICNCFASQADEINEVMGRSYGTPEVDEDDLAAELDALGDDFGNISL